MDRRVWLAVLVIVAIGCAEPVDTPPGVAEIESEGPRVPPLDVEAEWRRVKEWTSAGLTDSLRLLWSDSALVLTSGGTVRVDPALGMSEEPDGVPVVRRPLRLQVRDDLAIEVGALGEGDPSRGTYVTHWALESDDVWRIVLDAPMPTPPELDEPPQRPGGFDAFGLVRGSTVWQDFVWDAGAWRHTWTAMPEGVVVTTVDTLGSMTPAWLGAPRRRGNHDVIAYPVSDPETFGPRNGGFRADGYFVSGDSAHAAFRREDSPISEDVWAELASDFAAVADDTASVDLRYSVWSATVGSFTARYFVVGRGYPGRCDLPREEFHGLISGGAPTPRPIISDMSAGDCEGKGLESEQPVALIQRGGRFFVLIAVSGWGDEYAALKEISDERVMRVTVPGPTWIGRDMRPG